MLRAQGDDPGALAAYRQYQVIAGALVAMDPANTEWQRDLSVSHGNIGDVLRAQGDDAGALAAYRQSLTIAEALAAKDRASALWQTDLVASYWKLSQVAAPTEGRRVLQRGLDILRELARDDRLTADQMGWIPLFENALNATASGADP